MHVIARTRNTALTLALEACWMGLSVLLGLLFVRIGVPVFPTLLVFIAGIVMAGVTALRDVLWAVQRWRRSLGDPGSPWPALGPLLVWLCAAIVIGASCYIAYFCGNNWSHTTIIEGLNYSVQTVTTVGYGNWAPSEMAFTDPRLIVMKEFSIFLMLFGTGFWSVFVGVVTAWFLSQGQ